jgi:hypothetical protein
MNGVIHAQKQNKQIIEMMAEKVDRVIYLLLGDKYDNSFTLSELRREYGYPAVTDRELRDMIIDEMPD